MWRVVRGRTWADFSSLQSQLPPSNRWLMAIKSSLPGCTLLLQFGDKSVLLLFSCTLSAPIYLIGLSAEEPLTFKLPPSSTSYSSPWPLDLMSPQAYRPADFYARLHTELWLTPFCGEPPLWQNGPARPACDWERSGLDLLSVVSHRMFVAEFYECKMFEMLKKWKQNGEFFVFCTKEAKVWLQSFLNFFWKGLNQKDLT